MKHCACGAAPPPSIVRVDVRTSSMIHSIEFMCNRVFFLLAEPFPEDRGWSSEVKDRPTLARAWVWGRQACRRAETFWFNRGISNSIRPHSTRNAAIRFHERPQLKVIPKQSQGIRMQRFLRFYRSTIGPEWNIIWTQWWMLSSIEIVGYERTDATYPIPGSPPRSPTASVVKRT